MEDPIKLIKRALRCEDKESLAKNASLIQKELNSLLERIKRSSSLEKAESIFELLEEIQLVLAKATFKDEVILTPQLRRFVYDFDRIDDEAMRAHLYDKIRLGEYTL